MAITLQNLRSVTPGVKPPSLLPGQLCFNVSDEVMFVGDGSSTFTSFDGTVQPAPSGGGWFSVPLNLSGLSGFFLENPEVYSPAPTNNQVLTFSSSLGKPVWQNASGSGSVTAYVTTDAAVAAAPGVSVSAKISNALGITPVEADSAIVQGVPGDIYQGLYLFSSGNWEFAAGYANPIAIQVPYNNAVSGLVATTVQAALDELAATKLNIASNIPSAGQILSWNGSSLVWINSASGFPTAAQVSYDPSGTGLPSWANNVQDALTSTWTLADGAQTTANNAVTAANNAVSTANNALAVANAALPKAGGTMTGDISFNNGQPVDAGTF